VRLAGLAPFLRSLSARLLVAAALCALVTELGACAPTPGTIGAVLGQQTDGRVYLREVPPDLAAAQAGLKEGDELLLIEGQDVRQMSSDQIHYALEGEVGQPVRLTAVRGQRILRVTVTRTAAQKRSQMPPEDAPE
jgi:C-terminal processing protease CtpA/Prc